MKYKRRIFKSAAALLVLVIFLAGSVTAYAAAQVSLDVSQKTVYRNSLADSIITAFDNNRAVAVNTYDDMYYMLVGKVSGKSSDNKAFYLSAVNGKSSTTIKCSSKKSSAEIGKLTVGNNAVVYGKINIASKGSGSVSMTVDYVSGTTLETASDRVYTLVKNLGRESVSMDSGTMLERSVDNGKFNFKIPASWANVESELPNVSGYQYELNRLDNKNNAEFLFLFYIDDSYMEARGDIGRTIEARKAIIRNIIGNGNSIRSKYTRFLLSRDFDMVSLKTDYASFGSYSGNYYDANGTRYYTEFMFLPEDDDKPDSDKIVRAVLYVYQKDYHSDDILLMMRQLDIE